MCPISGHFLISGIQPDTGYALPDIRYPARPDIRPDVKSDSYTGTKKTLPWRNISGGIFHILTVFTYSYLVPVSSKNWQYLNDLLLTEHFLFSKCRISGTGIRPLPDIRPDIRYPAFRSAGYPAGRISDKFNIRPIPTGNHWYLSQSYRIFFIVSEFP